MSDQAEESLSKKGGRALGWTFVGTMLRALVQFLLLIVLTRLLMPENFGVMALAEASVFIMLTFAKLGVWAFLVQRKELDEQRIAASFTVLLLSGTLFTALLAILSGPIEAFFHEDGLGTVILAMSPAVFLLTVGAVPESLLMRRLEFRALALTDLAAYGVSNGIIALLLALNGAGVWALVAGFVSQELIRTVAMYWLQPPPRRLFINVPIFKELMTFGGGLMLGSACNQFARQIDRIIAGRYLGAADLGFYTRSHQLLVLPASLFGKVVERVLFPVMSSIQSEEERLANAFLRATATTALLTMPFSAMVCILAPEIISLLFGANWSAAVQPLQFLSLAIMFRVSYKISESMARAKAAVYRRAWRQAVFAVAMMIGSFFGSRYYGLSGLAVGTSIAVMVNYCLMTDLSCRILNLSYARVLNALLPSLWLTALIACVGYVSSQTLRGYVDSDLLVFMTVGSLAGVVGLLSILLLPKLFLGPDGYWTYQLIRKNLTLLA